jgi:hypothetical protein
MTKEQGATIQKLLMQLEQRKDVKEFDVLYNPLLPKEFMVRYKSFFVTEDNGISVEIKYLCVNRKGEQTDCQELYGEGFYNVLRDYSVIKLNNSSIQVI